MVEDCGGDRSWEIIRELARRDPRVKGIQFSRNFGQHYGITAGLAKVAAELDALHPRVPAGKIADDFP